MDHSEAISDAAAGDAQDELDAAAYWDDVDTDSADFDEFYAEFIESL